MKENLDNVLDDCLARIKAGEADVETCVSRYPEHADELRALLEAAGRLSLAAPVPPRQAAFSQGRDRLLRAVQKKREARRPLRARAFGWRWAPAMIAVALVSLSGFGVATASTGSIPGDVLYPVKTTTEKVRVALTLSENDRAGLQVTLAERRIQELVELSEKNDTRNASGLVGQVAGHLDQATRITRVVAAKGGEVEGLKNRLEQSAARQLDSLEQTLANASQETKPVLVEALQKAGEKYGLAVEVAASGTPWRPNIMAAGLGTIQVRASDPPAPDVESVVVEVSRIEVHRAADPDNTWITVVDSPVTFDLLKVAEVQKFLGSQDVPNGTYTQMRFSISKSTVEIGGKKYPASIPGEDLKLVRPFQVEEGKTTVILLDFDGSKSLIVSGDGEFSLVPAVKLLVPAKTGSPATDDDDDEDNDGGAVGPTGSGSTAVASQVKIEIEGVVQSMGESQWVVSGLKIALDAKSVIKGVPEVGIEVEVKATVRADGSFLARVIEIEEDEDDEDDDEDSNDGDAENSDDNDNRDNLPVPEPSVTPAPVVPQTLSPVAESAPVVTPVPQTPAPLPAPDRDEDEDDFGDNERAASVSRTVAAPAPALVAAVPTGTFLPTYGGDLDGGQQSPERTAPILGGNAGDGLAVRTEIEGAVTEYAAGEWLVVKGRKILITSNTRVQGVLRVGGVCEVSVASGAGGELVAVSIEVEGGD